MDELTDYLMQKSAENLAKKPRASKTDIGARVYVKLPRSKELTPAILVATAYSHEGNYEQCKLRIAQYDDLNRRWLVSIYPKPIQSYKLKVRKEIIPELDCPSSGQ